MKNLIVAIIIMGAFGISSSFAEEGAKSEMKKLYEAKRELNKKLHPIMKRLQVYNNEEVKELRKKASEANKALKTKMNEIISTDPEGKKLLDEIKANETQISELRKKTCQARRACKKGKEKKKNK